MGGGGYRRIAGQPRGAYTAFLVVSLCTAIALALLSGLAVSRTLNALLTAWTHLPAFSVTAARLTLPIGVTPPVRAAADGAVVVVTNTLPADANPLGGANVGLILTPRELVLRPGPGGDVALPLQALGPLPLTKANLEARLQALTGTGLWIIGVFSVLVQVGRDFVRAAIIAWVGLTMARVGGRNPSWPESWRVGLAAWTMPLLAEVLRLWYPYPAIWLWLIAGVYAVIGMYSIREEGGRAV